jgi:hypothetical protein
MRDGWKITGPNKKNEYTWSLRDKDSRRVIARVTEETDNDGFLIIEVFIYKTCGYEAYLGMHTYSCYSWRDRPMNIISAMEKAEYFLTEEPSEPAGVTT